MNIAIIGGGINGYCCGVQVLEHFKQNVDDKVKVTIISESFSPNTTGDGSAGLWGPYCLGDTPIEKLQKWSKSMHDFLEKIWLSEDAGEAGVCLIPAIRLTSTSQPIMNFWKDIVYGCTPLGPEQLNEFSLRKNKKFTHGFNFITYTSEPTKLLPYLMKRFSNAGGSTIKSKIEHLDKFIESNGYDVIINCTGLGSRNMIADSSMYSVRGQVSRVKANWLYHVLLDESEGGNYIIPNTDSVVLGGTTQVGDYNTDICKDDRKYIIDGCTQFIPALEYATHLFDWVGLRPGRGSIRLEAEDKGNNIIIHNYGHGGSGVTLAWGCADDVLELLKEKIDIRGMPKSKL